MGVSKPPGFQLEVLHRDGRAVVRVQGDLDLSAAAPTRAQIDALLATGVDTVHVDLTACSFVDSSGVAILARVAEQTRERAGRTVVAATAPVILRTLTLLGLDSEVELVAALPDGDAGG